MCMKCVSISLELYSAFSIPGEHFRLHMSFRPVGSKTKAPNSLSHTKEGGCFVFFCSCCFIFGQNHHKEVRRKVGNIILSGVPAHGNIWPEKERFVPTFFSSPPLPHTILTLDLTNRPLFARGMSYPCGKNESISGCPVTAPAFMKQLQKQYPLHF